MTKTFKSIDDVTEVITEITQEWVTSWNKDKLQKLLIQRLDKAALDFMLKVLGFNNHWEGKWEVDHCNGRMTVINELLSFKAKQEVSNWLDVNLSKMLTTSLWDKLRESLEKEFYRIISSELRYRYSKELDIKVKEIMNKRLDKEVEDLFKPSNETVEGMKLLKTKIEE